MALSFIFKFIELLGSLDTVYLNHLVFPVGGIRLGEVKVQSPGVLSNYLVADYDKEPRAVAEVRSN